MNRRRFAIALPLAGLLIGCDSDNDQKPSATATLFNSPEVQEAMKDVEDSIGDLEDTAQRFEGENWRDVVPDIQTAAEDVRDSFENLRQALGIEDS